MGRVATGVRGIRLGANVLVNALIIVGEGSILTATENGYGKRTAIDDYPAHKRGGQGVVSIQTTKRNGPVVGADLVGEDDEVMLISNMGTAVRTRAAEVSLMGRNTQGVRLINLAEGEKLAGIDRIVENGEEDAEIEDDDAGE